MDCKLGLIKLITVIEASLGILLDDTRYKLSTKNNAESAQPQADNGLIADPPISLTWNIIQNIIKSTKHSLQNGIHFSI